LNGFEIPLLLGSSYRCDWRTLQSEFNSVEKIIVVENLQAFDYIKMAKLPIELKKSAWIIYRGHNESNRAVSDLLNKLPKTCEIIGFTDYDPAGIEILLTSIPKITSCLLPELSEDLFKQGIGTEPIFQKQQTTINSLSQRELPKIINDYWQALLKHRVCLSQELLLSRNRLLHQISLFK
jgi:DNA topoisomerase VI subunit A